ncbi:MAG: AraC family transcriptional regulator [Pseudomonadota bacterium]
MKTLPRDITVEKIRDLDAKVDFKSFEAKPSDKNPLATGFIRNISPSDGLEISGANLNGQKGYSAKVGSEPGLSIELRMLGNSASNEINGEKRSVTVSPGDILLTGSNGYSIWNVCAGAQSRFKVVSVRYNLNYLEQMHKQSPEIADWAIMLLNSNASWNAVQTTELQCLAFQILACLETVRPETSILCNAYALRVLVSVWREYTTTSKKICTSVASEANEILRFARGFIEKNPHAGLTVSDVAGACRMSETAMKSLFKKNSGISIGSFILSARMESAHAMITAGVSISETSQVLGYSSPEALSKAVRKYFGQSPRNIL